ncbi:hypothetical protein Droror1_Dr00009030 [Drosera rotundifolia]
MIWIRNRLFRATTLLLFLVVVDVASAAWSSNLRLLIDSAPSQASDLTSTVKGAPLASPSNNTASATPLVEKGSPTIPSKDALNLTPPVDERKKETKDDQVKDKADPKAESQADNETCDGSARRCRDSKSLTACIKSVDDESKTLVLVQNQGDASLKVNITIPSSGENKAYNITEHKSQQINVSLNSSTVGNSVIYLNAGSGDCILKLNFHPVPEDNFFKWLPPYSELLTPMYGAYFLLLAIVIVGGMWACCIFRKRKRRDEIPYQELEMGISGSHVDVETADGWDQGWDDDWDDNKAVRSPGARKLGSISANGLTSRSGNKDGWEEWDE